MRSSSCLKLPFLSNPVKLFFPNYASTLILKSKFRGSCPKPLLLTILTGSISLYSYQKDERAKPGKLVTKRCSFSLPTINCLSLFPGIFTFIYSSTILSTSFSFQMVKQMSVVCVSVYPPTNFSFSVRHVSYERKVDD
jgi:hypothetical protein